MGNGAGTTEALGLKLQVQARLLEAEASPSVPAAAVAEGAALPGAGGAVGGSKMGAVGVAGAVDVEAEAEAVDGAEGGRVAELELALRDAQVRRGGAGALSEWLLE